MDQVGTREKAVWEVRQGDTLLGILTLNAQESDFPWYGCDLTPTPEIERFRPQFERLAYSAQLMSGDNPAADEETAINEMDTALDDLKHQGVVLVSLPERQVIADYLLHVDIDGRKGWFRY